MFQLQNGAKFMKRAHLRKSKRGEDCTPDKESAIP